MPRIHVIDTIFFQPPPATPATVACRLLFAAAVLFLISTAAQAASGPEPAALTPDHTPTALIELDGSGSENPEGGDLTYRWRQIDGPRVELSDPSIAKPYFRTGKPGLYRFELVVSANGLASEPFIVEIMIERDNQPPVARAPMELFAEVGKVIEIDGSGSFDPEGDALTYRWRSLTRGLVIPDSEQGKPVITLEPVQDGIFEIELVVSDGESVSRPAVTRLAVKPQPRPPVARARAIPREIPTVAHPEQAMVPPAGAKPLARIEGPAVSKLGDRVMLDARGSRGSEGANLEYLWRQKSGPFISDFELIYNGAAERFNPPRAGDYEFELVVSDGAGESEPAIHKLKVVNETDPPVAVVVAPTRAMPGALVKLDATQSYDMEGSPLVYRWRQTGGPKVTRYLIDEKIGDAAPAFHPPSPGIYSFELIVSNGRLQSKAVEIDIEVGDGKRPPALVITGPEVSNSAERVVLDARADHADGRLLSYSWRQSEGPSEALPPTNGPRAVVTPAVPGRYVFDVTASEMGQVVASARRTLEVFPPRNSRSVSPPVTATPPPTAEAISQPSTPGSMPALTPLLEMPPVPQTVQTGDPLVQTRPPVRPAAQIHPSSLGNGINFLEASPAGIPAP